MSETEAAANRRAQILNEAQRLFNKQGYRETNLEDVAAVLGIKRQAIYYYFKSKEDVLWELVERASDQLTVSARGIFDSDLAPVEKLTAVLENHVHQLLGDVEIFRLDILQRDKLSPDRHDSLRQVQRDYQQRVTEIISDGQRAGLFVDGRARLQAQLLLGMCNWALDWFDEDSAGTSLTVDEVASGAVRMALSGLLRDQ
jgi:TetR/AcrR family transcriptional regulator, cholesterol catabolism regulator